VFSSCTARKLSSTRAPTPTWKRREGGREGGGGREGKGALGRAYLVRGSRWQGGGCLCGKPMSHHHIFSFSVVEHKPLGGC